MRTFSGIGLLLLASLAQTGCITADVTEGGIYRPVAGGAMDKAALAQVAPAYEISEHQIIARDGAVLNGVLLTQPDATVTVLFFGGNGFTLEKAGNTAAVFEAFGVNLMMVDTRGYGTSAAGNDAPKVDTLMTDGEDIFDYTKILPALAGQKLLVHGHSMGSFVAGHVAVARETDGVVLQSSATTAADFANGQIPGLMKPFVKLNIEQSLQEQGNLKNMSGITEPLLIIVGSNDKQTVSSMSEKLYAASPLPEGQKRLAIIKGAGHNDIFASEAGQAAYRAYIVSIR